MKLEKLQYICTNGHHFVAPSLGDNAYGEFLLWSAATQVAYLNAFEDLTFKALDISLQTNPRTSMLRAHSRAKILHRIFGPVVCDSDENGKPFHMDMPCPCPVCGTQKMASWDSTKPMETMELEVNHVTHSRWNAMTETERNVRVDNMLKLIEDINV